MLQDNNNYLYTVLEYAEAKGISTQAVYKQVNKHKINSTNRVYNGKEQMFIVLSAPLQEVTDNQPTNQSSQTDNQPTQPQDNRFLEFLIEENKRLTEQNAELQDKLLNVTEELINITKNAQVLTSQSQTLQLQEKTQTAEETAESIEAEREEKKKNFFSRFFKK